MVRGKQSSSDASSGESVVHHHQVVADGEHRRVARTLDRGQVVVQQRQLVPPGRGEQRLLDAAGGGRGGGDHQRVRLAAPAGQVDDAADLARHRVPDRGAGTGQVLQVLDEVLVPEHLGRSPALQRGPDAVGADVLLGVGEAGDEPHPVQVLAQRGVPGPAVEDDPVGVAEDQADRLGGELVAQLGDDRRRRPYQRAVGLAADLGQVDGVGCDVAVPGPDPGRQDRRADGVLAQLLVVQERVAGGRDPFRRGGGGGPGRGCGRRAGGGKVPSVPGVSRARRRPARPGGALRAVGQGSHTRPPRLCRARNTTTGDPRATAVTCPDPVVTATVRAVRARSPQVSGRKSLILRPRMPVGPCVIRSTEEDGAGAAASTRGAGRPTSAFDHDIGLPALAR